MRQAQVVTADAKGRAWLRSARPTSPSERLVMGLLAQMAPEIRARFDDAQVEALRAAARQCQWGRHQLDLRLSLPLLAQRYYLVIVGGRERRSAERVRRERRPRPFWLRLLPAGLLMLAALGALEALR